MTNRAGRYNPGRKESIMKIEYFGGWDRDSLVAWLQEQNDSGKAYTLHNENGYEMHFHNGSVYEVVWGSWKEHTPTECFINGTLVQRTMEA